MIKKYVLFQSELEVELKNLPFENRAISLMKLMVLSEEDKI